MHEDEAGRLGALRRYAILDTPPEPNFDRITALLASIFDHPVCTLALADRDRHWFKSRHGVDAAEIPRAMSFCDHTLRSDAVFVVPDACADSRFAAAPLVAGPPHLRFYAGAPLVTPAGERIGSLCVLDTTPRPGFSEAQRGILANLASTVVELLEARARQIELAQCTEEIAHLARHDPLTGLPNRRRLIEVATAAVDRMRSGDGIALLYLDLDGFKAVNDRYGHTCGDALLKQVAGRLGATAASNVSVARLGGDEFVVLVTGIGDVMKAAAGMAGHLIRTLGSPYRLDDATIRIGVSIGVAVGFGRGARLDQLLNQADGALYTAKANGRGTFAVAGTTELERAAVA